MIGAHYNVHSLNEKARTHCTIGWTLSLIDLVTKSTRLCTLTGRTARSRDFERRRSETQARQVGSLDMELRSHDSRTVSPGSAGDEPNLVPACRCVTPVNAPRGPRRRLRYREPCSPPFSCFSRGGRTKGFFPAGATGSMRHFALGSRWRSLPGLL